MLLLAISLLALALAPLAYLVSERTRAAMAALDGFVLVTITGLVVIHLVPHAMANAGVAVIPIALFGLLAPSFAEHFFRRAAAKAHRITALFALGGLAVHAIADGMALASPTTEHGDSVLALAVLVHRFPVALTVWWLLRESRGIRAASVTLIVIAAATIAGFATFDSISPVLDSRVFSYFQALVSGSLLHVIFHQPVLAGAEAARPQTRAGAGFGALIGLLLVVYVADDHFGSGQAAGSIDFIDTFVTLVLETAPVLILAFAIAGVVQTLIPQASQRWLSGGTPTRQAMRGVVFGLPLPICSCGVVPLYDGLIRRGVPATAAMAFLVATPELGVDAMLISIPLLGTELTLLRLAAALVIALLIGRVIGAVAKSKASPQPRAQTADPRPLLSRLRSGFAFGFRDIVDDTGPWILFGLVIAALAEPLLYEGWLHKLPWGADVLLFAILGVPVYVCASGATPLAAILIHKGVSPGAALAFLLAGPATNITTFGILARLHGRRIAAAFGIGIALLAIGVGFLVNLWAPAVGTFKLHDAASDHYGWLAYGGAAMLGILYAASLLRIGPRGFLAQIADPFSEHSHDHDHGHGHDHCCDH